MRWRFEGEREECGGAKEDELGVQDSSGGCIEGGREWGTHRGSSTLKIKKRRVNKLSKKGCCRSLFFPKSSSVCLDKLRKHVLFDIKELKKVLNIYRQL